MIRMHPSGGKRFYEPIISEDEQWLRIKVLPNVDPCGTLQNFYKQLKPN
ncbi:hypothetical protein P4308_14280 [Bacillus wiedmannii]|nr:hypothetical protein [Bacillus wiedmannii]MBZ4225296.1 hypothetical protein [Bacillus wiedmannii]MED2933249.1 hypothetical protein [Bacillus wiedmannii]